MRGVDRSSWGFAGGTAHFLRGLLLVCGILLGAESTVETGSTWTRRPSAAVANERLLQVADVPPASASAGRATVALPLLQRTGRRYRAADACRHPWAGTRLTVELLR